MAGSRSRLIQTFGPTRKKCVKAAKANTRNEDTWIDSPPNVTSKNTMGWPSPGLGTGSVILTDWFVVYKGAGRRSRFLETSERIVDEMRKLAGR